MAVMDVESIHLQNNFNHATGMQDHSLLAVGECLFSIVGAAEPFCVPDRANYLGSINVCLAIDNSTT